VARAWWASVRVCRHKKHLTNPSADCKKQSAVETIYWGKKPKEKESQSAEEEQKLVLLIFFVG